MKTKTVWVVLDKPDIGCDENWAWWFNTRKAARAFSKKNPSRPRSTPKKLTCSMERAS